MDNVKKVISFILSLVSVLKTPLSKGNKFSWADLLAFGPVLSQFPSISAFKATLAELENSSEAQRADLLAFIKANFALSNADLEAKIEAGISIAIKLAGFAPEIKVLLQKVEKAAQALPGGAAQAAVVNVQADQVNVNPAP